MFGRDEKSIGNPLDRGRQYAILAIFLVLAYGLWRLQVMQSGYYASAAEKKPHSKCADSRAPREDSGPEGRIIVDNYPSFLGAGVARYFS